MQQKIYEILLEKNEITWKSIIQDLVKSGQVDPWDIDISLLAKQYITRIKQMQETNLFISGKMLLASALLLKMKSDKLVLEDFTAFENKLFPPEELFEEDMIFVERPTIPENPRLTIKTPQVRKKQVTVNDLVAALEKALEVNERKTLRRARLNEVPKDVAIPKKPVDFSQLITTVFAKIKEFFSNGHNTVTFKQLVPSEQKEDRLFTFVPLLHLANKNHIDLEQTEPFGQIDITLKDKQKT